MKYPTITGDVAEMHPSVTWKRVCEAVYRRLVSLDKPGFCLACGTDTDSVEPDARHCRCDSCGGLAVFGADEVLIMIT